MTATTTPTLGSTPALETIRKRREDVHLTRAALAARAEVSLAHLGNIEAGSVPRRSPALGRILAALDAAERDA
jgi:predicted transcriptional regulator